MINDEQKLNINKIKKYKHVTKIHTDKSVQVPVQPRQDKVVATKSVPQGVEHQARDSDAPGHDNFLEGNKHCPVRITATHTL
jgi:hypothetical protein